MRRSSILRLRVFRQGKGILSLLCLTLLGLTLSGVLYQQVASSLDRRCFAPAGELVDVGGHRLHMLAMGHGQPVVILETGLGSMSAAWGWVQPEVARFTRVIAYDRAGLGWSERGDTLPDAGKIADELHALLERAGIEGPFVMVGHSMGGLYVRVFADRHPEQVAGMVLIDASHPHQYERSAPIQQHMHAGFRLLEGAPLLAHLGILRLTGFFAEQAAGLPAEQRALADVFLCGAGHLSATRAEARAWEATAAQVGASRNLGDRPLIVLSAGVGTLPGAEELQQELAALSTAGERRVVAGADHVTLVTDRQHARTVVAAIREVVETVRAGR